MAQFFWQPDPADEGNPPSNAVITQPWASFTELRVVSDVTAGGHSLEMRETSGNLSRYGALFTELDGVSVPDSTDVEVYMRFVASGASNESMAAARADSTTTTANLTLYFGGLRRSLGEGAIRKRVSGNAGNLASSSALDQGFDVYKQRLRVNGSDLSLKVWLASDPEPGSWDLTANDTDITSAGKVGYYQETSTSSFHVRILDLGVGTDGDSAPTEDVSGTTGEISQTLPATSQALDGAVVPSGTAAQSLPALTQVATGSTGVDATGSASTTLPGLTQAAEGTSAVVGSLGITLAGGTFNIVPNSDFTMSGRRPLGEDTWDPNDPGTIAVVQGSASVNEDDGTITLSATRSGGTGAASVNWATQDGTAVDGTDYTSDSGTLNWADLETGTKSAVVSIIDRDGVAQGNTEFTWVLSGASGAEIRTDGGEPLDTTTVTINDQDTAGGVVNVLWSGDFEDGVGLGWHRPNDLDFPDMRHWNSYGYPPEFGGNGDLFEVVNTPTRGNDSHSMRVTVKNGNNWTEPDDCDGSNCDQRRSNMNGRNMYQYYSTMPKMNTYWIAYSVFLAAGWKTGTSTGNGEGSGCFGLKPDFLPSRSQLNVGLKGPGGTWRLKHTNHDVYQESSPSWKNEYRYHKDSLSEFADAELHFPNTNDSLAALASVNVGGWTDWIYHVHFDYRGSGEGGQGFLDLYKREDSGPWVHVIALVPGNVTWGGQTRDMGIGYNADRDWISGHGIYGDTSWFQDASVNQTMYLAGPRIYDGDELFDDIVNDRFGG